MAKRKSRQEPAVVRRDGGLCVTFANSASARRRSFETYGELLGWALRCGAVTGADAERLERAAAERRAEAGAVVRRALELRARFRRIFERLIGRQEPTDSDLAALRTELSAAYAARHFARSGIGCRWVWGDCGGDDLDRMLWPVAMSMAEVLSTEYCLKVRRCASDDCDLLFIARTGGSPRKWCSMKACGTRARSRRNYHRRVKPRREKFNETLEQERRERNRKARDAREREAGERAAAAGRRPRPKVVA